MACERPETVSKRLLILKSGMILNSGLALTVVTGVLGAAAMARAAVVRPDAPFGRAPANCPGGGSDRGVTVAPNAYNAFAGAGDCAKSPAAVRAPVSSPGGHQQPRPDPCARAAAAVAGVVTGVPTGTTLQGVPVMCSARDQNAEAPRVTPAQLAQRARESLGLPLPDVHTAPPRGSDGLVGLPEWVWVPRSQWHSMSKRASAGGVWAEVTATPRRMVIEPGAGLGSVACAGPGTAYDAGRSASAQSTECSYAYSRSSAGQPDSAYTMTVTVVWAGTWEGSGGAGGTLPEISRSASFPVRVAEGQGLYSGTG